MTRNNRKNARNISAAVSNSGLTIYDPPDIDSQYWIPTETLEYMLNSELIGLNVAGLPLRSRSKVVKQAVCRALGYPIPSSFKRTRPRFPSQDLDVFTQKKNNLQIWNDEIALNRRYAIIQISEDSIITKIKIINGNVLADYDTTGTLTLKYQARLIPGTEKCELIIDTDTDLLRPYVSEEVNLRDSGPIDSPNRGQLLSIQTIFKKLTSLIGRKFPDKGRDQERIRGADLHRLVCQSLGYNKYQDRGQFPDILHQLLEVKMQTSPTIDLGLVEPCSSEILDVMVDHQQIRHCDVRYALFYGETDGTIVELTHIFVTTGASFFNRFPQFQGKVKNKKLQIPLPRNFFDT